MYSVQNINNRAIWNNFVINNFEFYSFVDSFEWWEFQELEWNCVHRLGIFKWKDLIGIMNTIFVKAKRWNHLFVPHWPLIKDSFFEVLKAIIPDIQAIAKEIWAIYLRLNTTQLNSIANRNQFKSLGFINAPYHLHAENTHLLNLSLDATKILDWCRKTTKYIITRAIKEGVTIKESKDPEIIRALIQMHKEHAKRTNWKNTYTCFSDHYINNLFKVFPANDITLMYAEYNSTIEAMLITIRFGRNCVYYIGASDIKNPKFSPAYLLQYQAILKAKTDSCTIYNFWWVSPYLERKHPISWVSLFKRWFGWYDYDLLHAQDYVFNWLKYPISYCIESIRRITRWYYYKKPE